MTEKEIQESVKTYEMFEQLWDADLLHTKPAKELFLKFYRIFNQSDYGGFDKEEKQKMYEILIKEPEQYYQLGKSAENG